LTGGFAGRSGLLGLSGFSGLTIMVVSCAFASKFEPKTVHICTPNCPTTAVKLFDSIALSRIGVGQFSMQIQGQFWVQINRPVGITQAQPFEYDLACVRPLTFVPAKAPAPVSFLFRSRFATIVKEVSLFESAGPDLWMRPHIVEQTCCAAFHSSYVDDVGESAFLF